MILKTLTAAVLENCSKDPNRTIFTFLEDGTTETGNLSYSGLVTQAIQLSDAVQMKANDRVVIALQPGIKFIVAFFSCLFKGAIPVPVYPPNRHQASIRNLEAIATDCEANILLTNASLGRRLSSDAFFQKLNIIDLEEIPLDPKNSIRPFELPDEKIAYLQYTSGSVSIPKGVIISHENLADNLTLIQKKFGHSSESKGVIWLPPYHDMGLIGGIFQPLFVGMHTVLMPPAAFIKNPVNWLRAIDNYKATTSGAPNFAYDYCVQKVKPELVETLDLSSWKLAFNGAEPVRRKTIEGFTGKFEKAGFSRNAFYPCYGLAESTLFVSGGHYTGAQGHEESVPCGNINDTHVLIYNTGENRISTEGETGEILISGRSVTQGYWNSEPPCIEIEKRKYLRTGDIGYIEKGELYITGREKDIIIIRGKNFFAEDLEWSVKKNCPAIYDNRVVCVPMETGGAECLAVLVEFKLDQESAIDMKALVTQVRKTISELFEIAVSTVAIVRFGQLPVTPSGKSRRFMAKKMYEEQQLLCLYEETFGPAAVQDETNIKLSFPEATNLGESVAVIEKMLFERLSSIAGIPEFSRNSDISELGIDSMEMVSFTVWIEELLGFEVESEFLEKNRTIAEISFVLARTILIGQLEKEIDGRGVRKAGEQDKRKAHTAGQLEPIPAEAAGYFPEIDEFEARLGLYEQIKPHPFFSLLEKTENGTAVISGVAKINFSSNDYLGYAKSEQVINAVKASVDTYGTSASASRIVAGERHCHRELEEELSRFLSTEDTLTFVGGNTTNVSVVGHLFRKGDLVLYDELSHNSLLTGIELSGAKGIPFRHNNCDDLEALLIKYRAVYSRTLIFAEGIYSMDGDIADLPRLIELKEKHNTLLMIDECLSIGVLGKTGRGVCEHFGISTSKVDLLMGGISKALASCGGYISGRKKLIRYLRYTCPGFIYTTAMSPANTTAALASLRQLAGSNARLVNLKRQSEYFIGKLKENGFDTGLSKDTPVIPVIIGDETACLQFYGLIQQAGVNVQPILYPAVPKGKARLRFFINSLHTVEQLDYALQQLLEIRKEYSRIMKVKENEEVA